MHKRDPEYEERLMKFLKEQGYSHLKKLPDGRLLGLMRMCFTVGLFVNLNRSGYSYRYCYGTHDEALDAITEWDGEGDAPGEWKAKK